MKDKAKIARNITLMGALLDLSLGVVKILVGKLYFSQALITDGIHSLSDLLSDFFVLVMAKISFSEADKNHPYGHGKFENLGTIVIGVLLLVVGMGMAYDSYEVLFSVVERPKPGYLTALIALLSILGKEWIFRKTKKVGEELKSSMIIANAWHSRTDAISSIVILVGIICSIFINQKIDLLIAFAVSVYIGKIGYDFIKQALIELVDTSLDEETTGKIKEIVMGIDGVRDFHNLRSRKIGNQAILDINIEVNPFISVSEGHQIATWVARSIMDNIDDIYDVTVHTDVEDDRIEGEEFVSHEHELLPLRNIVQQEIKSVLSASEFERICQLNLHYLNGKLKVELVLKSEELADQIKDKMNSIDLVSKTDILLMR